jgi:hypothetical protein
VQQIGLQDVVRRWAWGVAAGVVCDVVRLRAAEPSRIMTFGQNDVM